MAINLPFKKSLTQLFDVSNSFTDTKKQSFDAATDQAKFQSDINQIRLNRTAPKTPVVSSNSGATNTKPTTIAPPVLKTPAAESYMQSLGTGAPVNNGLGQGDIPNSPPSAPSVPQGPSATDLAFSEYIKALQPSLDVTNASTEYNDYVANQSKSISGLEGQGRGIPLGLVRGQQEKLLNQTQPEALRLQNAIGIAQNNTTLEQNAAKAKFDYLSKKDTPTEIGGALVKLNPTTGKYETVYSAPEKQEGFTLGEGQVRYDAQGNAVATGPTKPNTGLGNLNLTPQQATQFNSIVDKFNKSPLIAAADRTIVLKNTIDQINKDPNNGPLQLNLVYSYIQALDTYQSAVREGELGLVNSIDSKVGKLQNYVQQIQNGQIVRPEVAKEIATAAKQLVDTISEGAKAKAKSYKSQSDVVGLGDAWDQYIGGFDQSYNSNGESGSSSDDLINKYLPGFSSVGNTSASIKLGSPLAIANNNPGNLRYAGQAGATQGKGGFAKFATPEAGVKALQNQITLDSNRGHTLESFINKYAPPVENNTSQYIQQAIKNLGVSASTPLKNIDLNKLTKLMALKESSSKIG